MSGTERLNAALAGRYKIEKQLGQGGMATVYLAHDEKHDRKVAVKVLKPELAAVLGAERFVVEIKTTAALQHPHILPLFDSGTADGFLYYVMPYIEGETLRDKLRRETQFGVDEAVRITTMVADALDYAHRHGVIHRDIKPENILLHDGRPIVADFGIALAVSAAAGGRMTETGLSLGTPHYMSPEQATADKDITARSDIYSLASVLYEMLAGQPPHMGNSAQMIIMRIIAEPVESVTKLRKTVPPHVAAALAQALEKLPADRFGSAADFAAALADRHFTNATSGAMAAERARDWLSDTRSRLALGAIGVLAVLAAMASGFGDNVDADPPAMLVRLAWPTSDSIAGAASNAGRPRQTSIAISPDGHSILFAGRDEKRIRQLFIRPLGVESATMIAGTDGAEAPIFSPDGKDVAFWTGGRLKRVPLAGGAATEIATVPRIHGGSWSGDRIAVGTDLAGVIIVSATGAVPPDTVLEPGATLPHFLPGGEALLFTKRTIRPGITESNIEVLTIKGGSRKTLVSDAADARYVPTGHLVFGRMGKLLAVPFDIASLSVQGSPVVLLNDVMQSLNGASAPDVTGAVQVAISPLGHLVYLPGGVSPDRSYPLAWLDRQGRVTPIAMAGSRPFFAIRMSPDDRQAVVTTMGQVAGVHVIDFGRGSMQTLDVRDFQLWPLWSPDGKRILHKGALHDSSSIAWSPPDGSRAPAPLVPDRVTSGEPVFWSADGAKLYVIPNWGTAGCLFEIELSSGSSKRVPGLPDECNDPSLSPNGKWLAYSAQDQGSGRLQVFVRTWPSLDQKWNVSLTGGSYPVWTRNGRELIFTFSLPTDSTGFSPQRVMSVPIGAGQDFTYGSPRTLFTALFNSSNPIRAFDVSRDGARFLVAIPRRLSAPAGEPRMIVNWFTEVRRLSVKQAGR